MTKGKRNLFIFLIIAAIGSYLLNDEKPQKKAAEVKPMQPSSIQAPPENVISREDANRIAFMKDASFCAGFYKPFLQGASEANCKAGDPNNFSTSVRNLSLCRAYLSNKFYTAVINENRTDTSLQKHVINNKSDFENEHSKGIEISNFLSSTVQEHQLQFDEAGTRCEKFMNFVTKS